MTTVSDVSGTFRTRFWTAAQAAITDTSVLVCLGYPARMRDDIVSIGDTTAAIDFATMTPNRTRELVLTQEGIVSVFRKGGADKEQVASERAYSLLNLIEEYFRGDGTPTGNARTTLDGLVRECFCTAHGPAGGSRDSSLIAQGRLIEIPFAFTARARITS